MGGIRLEIHDSIDKHFTLQLRLSEELVNESTILFPMRTGNRLVDVSSTVVSRQHDLLQGIGDVSVDHARKKRTFR